MKARKIISFILALMVIGPLFFSCHSQAEESNTIYYAMPTVPNPYEQTMNSFTLSYCFPAQMIKHPPVITDTEADPNGLTWVIFAFEHEDIQLTGMDSTGKWKCAKWSNVDPSDMMLICYCLCKSFGPVYKDNTDFAICLYSDSGNHTYIANKASADNFIAMMDQEFGANNNSAEPKDADEENNDTNSSSTVKEKHVSVKHFDEYCSKWNSYYAKVNPLLSGSYYLTEDQQDVARYLISYNENHLRMNYFSGVIPSTSSVSFMSNIETGIFTVLIINEKLDQLEKVTIIGEDNVHKELMVDSIHDEYTAWAIHMGLSEPFDYYYLDQFRVIMTIGGKEYSIDINEKTHAYLYDMYDWATNGLIYSMYDSSAFGDKKYLPPQSEEDEKTSSNTEYSFIDDINGMNEAAKSVFIVEVFDNNLKLLGTASGFVAFDEHLFVTNQHVIQGATYLRITDDTDEENTYILNQVIASDKKKDIAILLFPDGNKYASLKLNTSEDFKRGEPVVAIGSPLGLKNTLSKGDISAIRKEDGVTLIQTSASISHGSSGGALFDNNGYVIGVTSSGIDEGQNLNFAISMKAVQDMYLQWNKKSYEVLGSERSWNLSAYNEYKPTAYPVKTATPVPTATKTPKPSPKPTETVSPTTQSSSWFGTLTQIFPPEPTATVSPTTQPSSWLGTLTQLFPPEPTETVSPTSWAGPMGGTTTVLRTPKPTENATSTPQPTSKPTTYPKHTPKPTPKKTPTPTPVPAPSPSPTPQIIYYGKDSSYKIEIDQSDATIYVGNPVSFQPSVVSLESGKIVKNKKTTFTTSDETVAQIKNNKVIGVSAGDAVITCSLNSDSSVYSLIFVHVKEPVQSITLDQTSIEMFCNDNSAKTYQLKPVFNSDSASYDEITYKSSNEKVAYVTSTGKINAVSPGKATITVSVKLNGVKKQPKATVTVNVTRALLRIKPVETTVYIPVGKTGKLAVELTPKDASSKKLTWSTSSESVATVDTNGKVTGISEGFCTVTCSALDNPKTKCEITIRVISHPATSLKLRDSYDAKTFYFEEVNTEIPISDVFTLGPANITIRKVHYDVLNKEGKPANSKFYKIKYEGGVSSTYAFNKPDTIKFSSPGLYMIKATTIDGSNISATIRLRIIPVDRMTVTLNYAQWDYLANDILGISFQMNNEEYGLGIEAVELYVYATDAWGKKIYGDTIYYGTTEKYLGAGKSLYSDVIRLPNSSKISKVYCCIHKIKFSDDVTKTYTPKYDNYWNIK